MGERFGVGRRLRVAGCGLTVAAVLLGAGCGADPGPAPTVTTVPSATPSPTPTENAEERRQRLDFEAAEKAYLTADAEVNRLGQAGGTRKPTKLLLATTAGDYLRVQLFDLRTLKTNGWHTDRPLRTSVSANLGWSPTEIGLTACEDASRVRLLDSEGNEVAKDRDRRFVQTLTATKVGGKWKISGVDSKVVTSFAGESGCKL